MNKSSIRILGIAPYRFLPAINGGHKAIEQLYENISLLTQTIVVSTKSNEEHLAANYRLIPLFSNSVFHYINLIYFFRIKSLIKKYSITHVMIEHPYMGWLGFLLQQYAGISFTVRSHNIEAMRFKTLGKWWWRGMRLYEKWVFQKADTVFFITEEDKESGVHSYHLLSQKCEVFTYGVNQSQIPSALVKQDAKKQICSQYQIPITNRILLFNGDLGYAPNYHAVETLIMQIHPLLSEHTSFRYCILICGRNLPPKYIHQIKTTSNNIVYTGFVNDIVPYFLAADIFINPVIAGGGIKTKLVEAISYNCNAVSTFSGAAGIPSTYTKNKLSIVKDNDWKAFADAILTADTTVNTPKLFYDEFYWGNIAGKILKTLQNALP